MRQSKTIQNRATRVFGRSLGVELRRTRDMELVTIKSSNQKR